MIEGLDLHAFADLIGVHGFLHPAELNKLVELACNRDVLEVGAFRGLSAWGMALTAKSVTSVDTFEADTGGQNQTGSKTTLMDYTRATARYAPTHLRYFVGTSLEASVRMEGSWDMILIDALHDANNVRHDIHVWWPKLNAGGVMAFHDYNHPDFPGVTHAVNERFGPIPEAQVCYSLGWVYK